MEVTNFPMYVIRTCITDLAGIAHIYVVLGFWFWFLVLLCFFGSLHSPVKFEPVTCVRTTATQVTCVCVCNVTLLYIPTYVS